VAHGNAENDMAYAIPNFHVELQKPEPNFYESRTAWFGRRIFTDTNY